MNLHDHLDDAVSDVDGPDLTHLVRTARARGGRMRRRRRATIGAATAVAAALVVGAAALTLPDRDQGPGFAADQVHADSFDPADPGPLGPTDVRGVAAALRWSIGQVTDGTTSAYGGLGAAPLGGGYPNRGSTHSDLAYLQLDDADGLGPATVEVSVQSDGLVPTSPCRVAARYVESGVQQGIAIDPCHTRTLPDGSAVKSYEIAAPVSGSADDRSQGTLHRRVVILDRPDGVRVIVQALDGSTGSGEAIGGWLGEGDVDSVDPIGVAGLVWVSRPAPVLGFGALLDIAREEVWGPEIPQHFLDEGAALPGCFDSPPPGATCY